MAINPLLASTLIKGAGVVFSKVSEALIDPPSKAKPLEAERVDFSDKSQQLGSLLSSFQARLSSMLQPPYLSGAAEANREALRNVSIELAAELKDRGLKTELGELMSALEYAVEPFEEESVSLGSAFHRGTWQVLGVSEHSVLNEAWQEAKMGGVPVESVHQLALSMRDHLVLQA